MKLSERLMFVTLTVFFLCGTLSQAAAFQGGFSCGDVTEIPRAECEALAALYHSTNGPGWTQNDDWLVTNTPCSWYGVTCTGGGDHIAWIDLHNNNLDGTLPDELADLSQLNVLWLWSNRLEGDIHILPSITDLQNVDLRENQLTGTIPPEMGNLSHLEMLYLFDNQLVGSIPASLGNPSLFHLDLARNQLTGQIPSELGNLSGLDLLHLYENQLSGTIPASLGNLTQLMSLILSENQLAGSIPPELGKLSKLEWLILNNNQLSGKIPDELSSLRDLTRFLLAGNQLDGPIPEWVGSLILLEEFNLDDNALTGEIPYEITNLQDAMIALSNNACLTSSDPEVIAFLDLKDPGWQDSQTDCPTSRSVDIDIRPFVASNIINLNSDGLLPVAILSSPDFDARFVNVASLSLAGASAVSERPRWPRFRYLDANRDGLQDMLVQFRIQEMDLTAETTEVELRGETLAGLAFTGTDHVSVIPLAEIRLVAPSDGAVLRTHRPLFRWIPRSFRTCYEIQINNAPFVSDDQTALQEATVVNLPFYRASYLSGGTYYWRVRVGGSCNVKPGPWSDVWRFTIR